jgi:beta-glucosidase
MVTLHHFTHPSWFEAIGGWTSEVAVETWLRLVRFVVSRLDDLVTDWCTINEPNVFATGGHLFGEFPPGHRNDWAGIRRVLHTIAAHVASQRYPVAADPTPRG